MLFAIANWRPAAPALLVCFTPCLLTFLFLFTNMILSEKDADEKVRSKRKKMQSAYNSSLALHFTNAAP